MLSVAVKAQPTFLATFPIGNVSGDLYALKQTPDEGVVMAASYLQSGYWHTRVIKTDSLGNVQWTRKYGSMANAVTASCIELTPDSGYIFCGQLDSLNTGGAMCVTRLSSTGNVTWCRTYTSSDDSGALWLEASMIRHTYDNGFVITGAAVGGTYSMNVLKIDSAGRLQWMKRYCTGPNKDRAYDIQQLPDSGYVLCGKSMEYSIGTQEGAYVLRIDKNGTPLWGRGFGAQQEYPLSLLLSPDSAIVVTGFTQGMGFGLADIMLLKIDYSGNLLWAKAIGNTDYQQGASVAWAAPGRYVITGHTSPGIGFPQPVMLTTDMNGNLLHAKTYPGIPVAYSTTVAAASGYGYVSGGNVYDVINQRDQPYLLRTDSACGLICGATDLAFAAMNITPQLTQGFSVDSGGTDRIRDPKNDSLAVMAPAYVCSSNAGFYFAYSELCAGNTPVHFTNLHDSSSTSAYWYINNALTDSTFHFDYAFTTPGVYTILQVSQPGNDSASMNITINPLPVVSFQLPDTVCFYGPQIHLLNYASPAGGLFYGGTVSTGDTSFYPSFAGPGNHTIYYSYTNPFGCTAIDSQTVYVKMCFTGIDEPNNGTGFMLYPNPASDEVTLHFSDTEPHDICIFDLSGQLLLEQKTTATQERLSLTGLAGGCYFIRVQGKSGIAARRLFISR
jgi:hypothetical protein